MMKKVTLIQLLINHGVPTLGTLFEEFKNALIIHVQEMERVSKLQSNDASDIVRLTTF